MSNGATTSSAPADKWPLRYLSVSLSEDDDTFESHLSTLNVHVADPLVSSLCAKLIEDRKNLRNAIKHSINAIKLELQQRPDVINDSDKELRRLQELLLTSTTTGIGLAAEGVRNSLLDLGELHKDSGLATAVDIPHYAARLQRTADALVAALGPELIDHAEASLLLGSTEARRLAWIQPRRFGPKWHWTGFGSLALATYLAIAWMSFYFEVETEVEIIAAGAFAVTVLFEYMLERIEERTRLMDRGADGKPFWSVRYLLPKFLRSRTAKTHGQQHDTELERDVFLHLIRWLVLVPAMALALAGIYAAFQKGAHKEIQSEMSSLSRGFEDQARERYKCLGRSDQSECRTPELVLGAIEKARGDTIEQLYELGCGKNSAGGLLAHDNPFCTDRKITDKARKAADKNRRWFFDSYDNELSFIDGVRFRYEDLILLRSAHDDAFKLQQSIEKSDLGQMKAELEAIRRGIGVDLAPKGTRRNEPSLRQLLGVEQDGTLTKKLAQHKKDLQDVLAALYGKPPEQRSVTTLTSDIAGEVTDLAKNFDDTSINTSIQQDNNSITKRLSAHKDAIGSVLKSISGPPPTKASLVDIDSYLSKETDALAKNFDNTSTDTSIQQDNNSITKRLSAHKDAIEGVLKSISGPPPTKASLVDIDSYLSKETDALAKNFDSTSTNAIIQPGGSSLTTKLGKVKTDMDADVQALVGKAPNGLTDGASELSEGIRDLRALVDGVPSPTTPKTNVTNPASLYGAIDDARQRIGGLCK